MLGLALVRPLEDDWRDTLDAIAEGQGWPTSRAVSRLADAVAALSAAYNDPAVARAGMADAGPARLGFSFARDVPKGAAAVRELVATGALRLDARPLRVLDVGAGLGASTWGLARALEAAGQRGVIEATLWDADGRALELAARIARQRERARDPGPVAVRMTTVRRALPPPGVPLEGAAGADVVLAGHVLCELDLALPPGARAERHAELLRGWLHSSGEERASLVVIEPALRDRTRHLHGVRDALAARGVGIFAPCLHEGPCPALAQESDWCHEDLPVDLPPWLVPVARAAGLRHQGLTFSYLVARRDELRLARALPDKPGSARLRVVSDSIRSKGKREAFLCGAFGGEEGAAAPASRLRTTRLDRDATSANEAWAEITRGDVLLVEPAPAAGRPRVAAGTLVRRLGDTESR